MKRVKQIGFVFSLIAVGLMLLVTLSEHKVALPLDRVESSLKENAQLAIDQQKADAKHAVSWAAKALFSFILPENQ